MLAGCAATANVPTDDGAAQGASVAIAAPKAPSNLEEAKDMLASLTAEDLQLASDDAHAHDDRLAYTCYDYVASVLPQLVPETPNVDTSGHLYPVYRFQKGRDLVKLGQKGLSDDFKLACSGLKDDVKDDARGIVALIASVAAKLGIKGFSGGLL